MLKRRQIDGLKDDLEEATGSPGSSLSSRSHDDEEVIHEHKINVKGIFFSLFSLILLVLYFYSHETINIITSMEQKYLPSQQTPQNNPHIIAINEPQEQPLQSIQLSSSSSSSSSSLSASASSPIEKQLPNLIPDLPQHPLIPPPPPPSHVADPPREIVMAEQSHANLDVIENQALDLIQQLKKMKQSGVVMETDSTALELISQTQSLLRQVLTIKYGPGPHYVSMGIKFPSSMMNLNLPSETSLIIELAPIEYIPYSVYFFLEYIVHEFKSGNFHRNAGHVLQAMLTGTKPSVSFAWQEYSPKYPHKKYTLGYAGRPSSSRAIYISTVDNTDNHGPGSQGSKTEADCLFGKIINRQEEMEIIQRMTKQPGAQPGAGWINDKLNYIEITSLELLPPSYQPLINSK